MKYISTILFVFVLITQATDIQAQSKLIEDLRNELSTTTNDTVRVDLQISLAHYFADFDLDSSLYYSQNVINYSKQHNDYINLFFGYLKTALALWTNNNSLVYRYEPYLDSAYQIVVDKNYTHGYGSYYQLKGIIEYFDENYSLAIENYLEAKRYYEKEESTNGLAFIIYNVLDIYSLSSNYNKALSFLEENDSIIQLVKDNPVYYNILSIKGLLLLEVERPAEALLCFKNSYLQKKDTWGDNTYYINLQYIGAAYYKLGQKDSADHYFKQCMDYLSVGNDSIIPGYYFYLTEYLLDEEEYSLAEKYLLNSLRFTESINSPASQINTLIQLEELAEKTNKYKQALNYIHQYEKLKDSIQYEKLDFMLDHALSDQELSTKIENLTLLKKQYEAKNNRLVKLLFLFTCMLFFGFWFYQNRLIFQLQSRSIILGKQNKQNIFWKSSPHKSEIKVLGLILLSIAFSAISTLLIRFFNSQQLITTKLWVWFVLSGMLFFVVHRIYFLYNEKQNKIPLKKELSHIIILVITLNLISNLLAYELQIELNTTNTFLNLTLLLLSAQFSTLIILQFINYRNRNTLINNELFTEFNKIIQANQQMLNKKTELVEKRSKTIEIEEIKVDLSHLIYVVSENIYQEFISQVEGKEFKQLARCTLKAVEDKLNTYPEFLRCHRSYIINTNYIKSIEGNSRQHYFVLKNNKTKIPISRSLDDKILEHFNAIMSEA